MSLPSIDTIPVPVIVLDSSSALAVTVIFPEVESLIASKFSASASSPFTVTFIAFTS